MTKLPHFPHPVHRVKQQRKHCAHLQPALYPFSPSPAGRSNQKADQHAGRYQHQNMRQAKHNICPFSFFLSYRLPL